MRSPDRSRLAHGVLTWVAVGLAMLLALCLAAGMFYLILQALGHHLPND